MGCPPSLGASVWWAALMLPHWRTSALLSPPSPSWECSSHLLSAPGSAEEGTGQLDSLSHSCVCVCVWVGGWVGVCVRVHVGVGVGVALVGIYTEGIGLLLHYSRIQPLPPSCEELLVCNHRG